MLSAHFWCLYFLKFNFHFFVLFYFSCLIDVDGLFNRKDVSLSCTKKGEYSLLVISILHHLQLTGVMQDLILRIMSELTSRFLCSIFSVEYTDNYINYLPEFSCRFRRWFKSMLIENGGQFSDVFRAKHPDKYGCLGYLFLLNIIYWRVAPWKCNCWFWYLINIVLSESGECYDSIFYENVFLSFFPQYNISVIFTWELFQKKNLHMGIWIEVTFLIFKLRLQKLIVWITMNYCFCFKFYF